MMDVCLHLRKPQAPSPGIVFDTLQAYQRSVALKAGIDLDLFTAIAEGNTVAKRDCRAHQGVREGHAGALRLSDR